MLHWTWDPDKNDLNKRKHGIDFETVLLVFNDPLVFTQSDPYPYEQRWRTMGTIHDMVVIVMHTTPEFDPVTGEEVGRIISARQTTSRERKRYEEGTY